MYKFIPILILWLVADIYLFQAIKTVTVNRNIWKAYWLIEGMLVILAAYLILSGKLILSSPGGIIWPMVILSLIPKLLVIPLLLLEDGVRIGSLFINWVSDLLKPEPEVKQTPVPLQGRKKFISQLVIGISSIPFFGLLYGMTKGKYDYRVHRIKLKFRDLPVTFNGFTITQLSDIHSGSLDNRPEVERGIALANAQKSDLMLFTGDLINNRAEEMNDWKETFSKLRAPFGAFSILGNHDYGDYITWESEEAKSMNLKRLKKVHEEIGFRLMLNESIKIEKNGQQISLIGVENWGINAFQRPGDLNKATRHVNNKDFKILMSHDPSHWDAQILAHPKHIHLTLAGHTHGMQFGIEIPGIKWSPIKYVYPQWAGLYRKDNKCIYVNRGFGFLGYPGRLGIWPEITVITLEKA